MPTKPNATPPDPAPPPLPAAVPFRPRGRPRLRPARPRPDLRRSLAADARAALRVLARVYRAELRALLALFRAEHPEWTAPAERADPIRDRVFDAAAELCRGPRSPFLRARPAPLPAVAAFAGALDPDDVMAGLRVGPYDDDMGAALLALAGMVLFYDLALLIRRGWGERDAAAPPSAGLEEGSAGGATP